MLKFSLGLLKFSLGKVYICSITYTFCVNEQNMVYEMGNKPKG